MHKGFLIAFPEQPMYECMKTCYVHEDMPAASYDVHIDVCYLPYDMICLLYVFYIEFQLPLSGGLKSITVV